MPHHLFPCLGHISIHVLREEDDFNWLFNRFIASLFLSTSSARRTTIFARPARRQSLISIHVLREEDDSNPSMISRSNCSFLSTSSARRTTPEFPRVEFFHHNFYPRPPRGGRPLSWFLPMGRMP